MRLLASLGNDVNYFGTDPNINLCEGLNNIYSEFNNVFSNSLVEQPTAKIYNQGSEIFIPELEDKIGLAFSSPPYFDLEVYCGEETQSIKNHSTYESWSIKFLQHIIVISLSYLKQGGISCWNVGKVGKHNMHKSVLQYHNEINFERIESLSVKSSKRQSNQNVTRNEKSSDDTVIYKKEN